MRTEIILFNPDTRFKKKIWIPNQPKAFLPISLLAVSAPLIKAGYEVKIIDQRIGSDWKDALLAELKKGPVCMGITVIAGPVVKNALEVSRFVRENSDIPIVWGGVHPSMFPEQTIENSDIDIVVKGEGEESFLELVNAIKEKTPLDNVRGIYYKQDKLIMNTGLRPYIDFSKQLPYPYHLIDMRKYILEGRGYKIVDFISSRGCSLKCSFCCHAYYEPGHWVALSAEETLSRIRYLRQVFGINGISFWDENFFVSIERARGILEGFIKEKFNLSVFKANITIYTLSKNSDDFLKLLEDSGVIFLLVGVESGSQRMLKLMNKAINIPDVISVNKRLSKFRIYPHYSFIIGLPTETEEDLRQTVKLYLKLIEENKRASGTFCIYAPRFGTGLFELSSQYGLTIPKTLEEWIDYPYTQSDPGDNKPWIDAKKRRLLMNIRFCSLAIYSARKYIYFYKTSVFSFGYFSQLLANLCFPLIQWRLRNLEFRFFVEKIIADFIVGEY